MAKITQPASDERNSAAISLEIRPWVKAAYGPAVMFSLPDSGGTSADSIYWIDVTWSVGGLVVFYTRNFIQHFGEFTAQDCEDLIQGKREGIGLGDMYPDSWLSIQRHAGEGGIWYGAEINLNMARVYGAIGDEWRAAFQVDFLDADQIRAFAQDLEREFADAQSGLAPDPAEVPDGYGTLPFARQLNARAYDVISEEYGGDLFDDEQYRIAFEDWVALLPPGGHVLDIGCGHGMPVVATLLARGFEVTGIDLSEGILARARAAYPAAHLRNLTAAELTEQDRYDGVCSFFSLLHTDPIELRVALDRIRRALKPGGYLLIGSLMSDLSVRFAPMYRFKGQWVWGNEFSLEEIQTALTEYNRFTIVHVTEDIQDLKKGSDQASFAAVAIEPANAPPTEGEQLIAAAQTALASTSWLNGKSARQFFTVLAQRPTN